jgi:phospholipid/cholesterol/gamma-HCH transport system substrate-binding protein
VKRAIRMNARWVATMIGLAALAMLVGGYILHQQGLRFPWVEEKPVRMHAVLTVAQAVTPGQGQSVQVAGVKIGKIADVELRGGQAVLGLDIERKYADEGLIRTDARALLRPRTPLKDMYLQVFPGSRDAAPAKGGFELPIQATLTDVNLDEIVAQLDTRTRDYLTLLVSGTGQGLKGRGADLAEVFRRFGPTVRDLGRVNRSVANERVALRRLVTSLSKLSGRLARKPKDLSQLVSTANATFGAFASEDANLRDTVAELPATLRQATSTLADVRPFANELGPATKALTPTVRALDDSNPEVKALAREATPIVRSEIRPFARAARPVTRDLRPAATNLAATLPELQRDAVVLNRFLNMVGYNPKGREAPGTAGREEGYLFWIPWVSHQAANLINVDDANGPMRPIFLTGTCATLTSLVNDMPALEFAAGLSPLLATLCRNPQTASLDLSRARKRDVAQNGPLAAKGRR